LDEVGDGIGFNDDLGLLSVTRGNVGKGPGGLELKFGVGNLGEELDEPWYYTRGNDFVDGRVSFNGKEFADLSGSFKVEGRVGGKDLLYHEGKILKLLEGGSAQGGCVGGEGFNFNVSLLSE